MPMSADHMGANHLLSCCVIQIRHATPLETLTSAHPQAARGSPNHTQMRSAQWETSTPPTRRFRDAVGPTSASPGNKQRGSV